VSKSALGYLFFYITKNQLLSDAKNKYIIMIDYWLLLHDDMSIAKVSLKKKIILKLKDKM